MTEWLNPVHGGQQYGMGTHVVGARDAMDARRLGAGRTPEAEYPDGYLGTIQSRREDRLLTDLKKRLGDRSYQRGVHKGERIDPSDYLWPAEFTPDRGLAMQARGLRQAPLSNDTERLLYGSTLPERAQAILPDRPELADARRQRQLGPLRPSWS